MDLSSHEEPNVHRSRLNPLDLDVMIAGAFDGI